LTSFPLQYAWAFRVSDVLFLNVSKSIILGYHFGNTSIQFGEHIEERVLASHRSWLHSLKEKL
jgi:hypothetical protein